MSSCENAAPFHGISLLSVVKYMKVGLRPVRRFLKGSPIITKYLPLAVPYHLHKYRCADANLSAAISVSAVSYVHLL